MILLKGPIFDWLYPSQVDVTLTLKSSGSTSHFEQRISCRWRYVTVASDLHNHYTTGMFLGNLTLAKLYPSIPPTHQAAGCKTKLDISI